MARSATFAACVALVAGAVLCASELHQESGPLSVRARQDSDGPLIEILNRESGAFTSLALRNRTEKVEHVSFVAGKSIIIQGPTASQYARDATITLIGWESHEILDTVYARDPAISPDGRMLAYLYRAPNPTGQGWPAGALAVYDLAAPTANPGPGPYERGLVLYPDEHRQGQHFVLLDEDGDGCNRKRGFVSPIAWTPDSSALAIVEHEGREVHLVLIDLTSGARHPAVRKIPIPRGAFLSPVPGIVPQEESREAYVSFQELRFGHNARAVILKSWGLGPFVERTFTLEITRRSID